MSCLSDHITELVTEVKGYHMSNVSTSEGYLGEKKVVYGVFLLGMTEWNVEFTLLFLLEGG